MNHILRIIGSTELPEPLELKTGYSIGANVAITRIEQSDDEAGSYEYTYKAKLITAEILKPNGKVLKTKVKGSQSQKLRFAIIASKPENTELDDEEYYKARMGQLIHYFPEVTSLLNKLDQ